MTQTQPWPILVVEDDRSWQTMLRGLCQDAGFQVEQVYDVPAAEHYLQGAVQQPILAIVDLRLRTSVPQQAYEGVRLLTRLRACGIYAMVVSGNIPYAQDMLAGRPEIRRLVDKAHFEADTNFGRDVFVPWVQEAVAYAEAARHAEGQLPAQQACLRRLSINLLTSEVL